jgi:predicted ferric reductase
VEDSASHQGGRGREFPTIDPRPPVEKGVVTADVLRRHLPREFAEYEYFVCGPVPMINSVERALTEIGVPARSVHTERFQMV